MRWQVWVDTGGTFTDCLARDPDGRMHRAKVLSSSALRGTASPLGEREIELRGDFADPPADLFRGGRLRAVAGGKEVAVVASVGRRLQLGGRWPHEGSTAAEVLFDEEAPLLAARVVTRTAGGDPLPLMELRLATTRGTNALLERRGAEVALFVTRGFGDLLAIGNQQRPDLFALEISRPAPLYEHVIEVSERLDREGAVIEPLDEEEVRRAAAELRRSGVDRAAIALLHSYRDRAHEEQVAEILAEEGFVHVSVSSRLAPRVQVVRRAETAVVNAYLSPVIEDYVRGVRIAVGDGRLRAMTSSGGLRERFEPKDSLLSGPAGGVVGAAARGRESGEHRLIAFDMGGTSTDVSRVADPLEYSTETRVGGARIVAPALSIETVAAGGGSICRFDGHQLAVGPESAGAAPGPACYGAGGPLALTDVNLLLGRIDPGRFSIPLDRAAAEQAARELVAEVAAATGEQCDLHETLVGLLTIANERMAEAIRRISLRRGYAPKEHCLVAFGGAGGQHACALAELLGITRILVPAEAGLLSAYGLGAARLESIVDRQVLRLLSDVEGDLGRWFDELESAAAERLAAGGGSGPFECDRRIALRLAGQETALTIDGGRADPRSAFAERYQDLYGYSPPPLELEVESLRLVASASGWDEAPSGDARRKREVHGGRRRPAWLGGALESWPVFRRAVLERGDFLHGPALIEEAHSATVVEAGWDCVVDGAEGLILERIQDRMPSRAVEAPRAVELELFTHRFEVLAEQMGEVLRRTAVSVNVKERLDFSCALLDTGGRLVVNAPHIPVHLGALGLCVRGVAEALRLEPGDVAVTNHPAFGGSHLPDVTVITPVFAETTGAPLGYVASRAHHAEIGGVRPGSMPPAARSLAEEGVVIPPSYLVRRGEPRWDTVRDRLLAGEYPTRAVDDNIADLQAAVAANRRGERALIALAEEHGRERVAHFMRALTAKAAERLQAALERLPDGRFRALERLDDGTPLEVCVTIEGDRATVDFSGSGDVHPGNLNATPAIVQSVVLYVLRLLLAEPLPLNEGLSDPVTLKLPRGVLAPEFAEDAGLCPAVVGGNVETSQRLVDTLLKALELVAGSQGTMNNLLFGDDTFGYYETICGGAGAGAAFDGASAVHTHMTNTAITDPEIVELRYPVRLEEFSIRHGSGGGGLHRGGDGARRVFLFERAVALSILSQHRTEGPYGLFGGLRGAPGRQILVRADGRSETLEPIDERDLQTGDRLIVETPGGGGWGAPPAESVR